MSILKDSKKICYKTYGSANNPALVLINGIGGQLISWPQNLLSALEKAGFYLITFDNRDSGLSHSYDELLTPVLKEVLAAREQGKTLTPPYTLDDMAEDIIILLDALNIEKAHIAGLSMGGMIAQVFALNYPDRTLSLICISTTTGDTHLPPPRQEILDYFTSPNQQQEDFASFINRKVEAYKIYHHPDYFDAERAREFSIKAYKRAYNPLGFTRQMYAVASAIPRGEQLRLLSLPSLIIHGSCDPVFPLEHGEFFKQVLPHAKLIIIENMGHGLLDCFSLQLATEIEKFIAALK